MTRTTIVQTALRLGSAALVAAGLVAGLAGIARPAAAAGDCAVAPAALTYDYERAQLLALINDYRQFNGVYGGLQRSGTLDRAAQWMSDDMVRRNDGRGHVDSLGRNTGPSPAGKVSGRLADCGYTGFSGAYSYKENVCCSVSGSASVRTAAAAFEAWRTSTKGHNEAMLDASMKFAGIGRGCTAQTCYWTLDLGSQPSGATPEAPMALPEDRAKPDLLVRRITRELNDAHAPGATAVYQVAINNLGLRPGAPVVVTIAGGGALQVRDVIASAGPDAARHFTCAGSGTVTCTGPLGGGEADAIQDRVALLRVNVLATSAGAGSLTVTVDPDNRIAENLRYNNTRTLQVTIP